MGEVRVKNLVIAYSIHGSGEPLILIGGFSMSQESWRFQTPDLGKRFRVVTFDNRGVGQTRYPPVPFTIEDMAADTVGLMDALGIESAYIFGVSMGGLIAQILLLDYPNRVKRAALGCTTHGGRHAVQPEPEVMGILAKAADPSVQPEEAIRAKLPVIFPEHFIREEPERIEEYVRNSLEHVPTPVGAAAQFKALSTFNVKRRLGEILHSVLVITGSEDRMMPPDNSRLLAEGIQGARLHMVEGAGHMFFEERPDEVNQVLAEFFLKPSS